MTLVSILPLLLGISVTWDKLFNDSVSKSHHLYNEGVIINLFYNSDLYHFFFFFWTFYSEKVEEDFPKNRQEGD